MSKTSSQQKVWAIKEWLKFMKLPKPKIEKEEK